jgi:hypothetical protein
LFFTSSREWLLIGWEQRCQYSIPNLDKKKRQLLEQQTDVVA